MADSVGRGGFPKTGIQEGHLHFNAQTNILYIWNGGSPAIDSNWSEVGGSGVVVAGSDSGYDSVTGFDTTVSEFIDDFIFGFADGTVTDEIANGWVYIDDAVGGIAVYNTGVIQNRVGVLSLVTTAAIGSRIAIGPSSNSAGIFSEGSMYDLLAIVAAQVLPTVTIRVGLNNAIYIPTNGAYFEKLSTDVNWFAVTNNGAPTRVDTGVAVTNNYTKLRIQTLVAGGPALFSIDGVLVATKSDELYTGTVAPQLQVRAESANAYTLLVDYVALRVTGLTRVGVL